MKHLFAVLTFATLAIVLFWQFGRTRPDQPGRDQPGKLDLSVYGIEELSAQGRPLTKFVPESVEAALGLREALLDGNLGESQAVTLGRLSANFAEEYTRFQQANPGTATLFDFSDIDFASGIRGSESCPTANKAYGRFTGKWYGRWEQRDVDHHWSRVVEPGELSFTTTHPQFQVGWQYAWIGDGYGINHCMSFQQEGETKRFLLGYTEHLESGDFGKIVAKRPHVGIFAGEGKLIWITAREVFFEQSHAGESSDSKYSIIGFRYQTSADELAVQDGFVTEYSANVENRTPFREFDCSCSAKRLPK